MRMIIYFLIFLLGFILGMSIYLYRYEELVEQKVEPGINQMFIDDSGVCYKYDTVQIDN